MPLCTLNNLFVSQATIDIPRIGVWHADLLVDSFESFTGKAIINFGSQVLNGTFGRNGPDINKKLRARVLGGAGALPSLLPAKGYRSVPLKIPLLDALNSCGEKLSPTADATVLNYILSSWSRIQMTAGQVISALLQLVSPNLPAWRVLADGTIWVGYEYWKASQLQDAIPLYSEPERGCITLFSIDPIVYPGETITYLVPGKASISKKVSYVRHIIRPKLLHTIIYYEDT